MSENRKEQKADGIVDWHTSGTPQTATPLQRLRELIWAVRTALNVVESDVDDRDFGAALQGAGMADAALSILIRSLHKAANDPREAP